MDSLAESCVRSWDGWIELTALALAKEQTLLFLHNDSLDAFVLLHFTYGEPLQTETNLNHALG